MNLYYILLPRQLDALIAQIEVLQTLLDRVGGAKQATQPTKTRRSSPQDNSFDSVHYKLSDCAAAVQKLETTVSLMMSCY